MGHAQRYYHRNHKHAQHPQDTLCPVTEPAAPAGRHTFILCSSH
jgi:hypothetical protein